MQKILFKVYQSQEGALAILLVIVILTTVLTAGLTIATIRITRLQFVQDSQALIEARTAAVTQKEAILKYLSEQASEQAISKYYKSSPTYSSSQTNCDEPGGGRWDFTDHTNEFEYCIRRIGYMPNPFSSNPKQYETYEILARSRFDSVGDVVANVQLSVEAPFSNYTKITPVEIGGGDEDFFGANIDIYNNRLIVGAPCDSICTGQAFIYEWDASNDAWIKVAVLTPSLDPDPEQRFGRSVAIWGDYAAVGAPNNDLTVGGAEGAVFIYKRQANGSWALHDSIQTLSAPYDLNSNESFGSSVSLYEDWLAIGAEKRDQGGCCGHGGVFLFKRDMLSDAYLINQEIAGTEPFSFFGGEVYLNEDKLIIGAPTSALSGQNEGGAFYVYERDGSDMYNLIDTHSTPILTTVAWFGSEIVAQDDTIVVGAWRNRNPDIVADLPTCIATGNGSTFEAGVVHMYKTSGSTYSEAHRICDPTNSAGEEFGFGIDLYGNTLAIGAPGTETYVSVRERDTRYDDDQWQERVRITSPVGNDGFGNGIAVNDRWLVVGAPRDDDRDINGGAIYIFNR